jgi:hypothetical protein
MARDVVRARIRNVRRLRLYGPAVLIGICLVAYNLLADEACIEEEIESEGQVDSQDEVAQKERQRKDENRLRGTFVAYAGFDSQMASDLRKSGNPEHTPNHKTCERTCYFRYDCTGFVLRTAPRMDAVRYRHAKTCYFQTAEPLKLVMGKGAAHKSTLFVYQNSSHKLALLLASMGLSKHFGKLEAYRAAHNSSSIERIGSSVELRRVAGGMDKADAERLWSQLQQGQETSRKPSREVSREASRAAHTAAQAAIYSILRLRQFMHGQDRFNLTRGSFNLTRAERSSSTITTTTTTSSSSPPLCYIGTCCGWGHKLRRVAASFVEIHFGLGRVAAVDLGSCGSGGSGGSGGSSVGSFEALFFDSRQLRGASKTQISETGFLYKAGNSPTRGPEDFKIYGEKAAEQAGATFDEQCKRANTIGVGWDQGLSARVGAGVAAGVAARGRTGVGRRPLLETSATVPATSAASAAVPTASEASAAVPTASEASAAVPATSAASAAVPTALPDLQGYIAPTEALLKAEGKVLDVKVAYSTTHCTIIHYTPCMVLDIKVSY